ncbi:MAG TPA: hypothetical protein RMF84_02215 [Polyangiaceae bacterium LLY-WYZ-14_1]|nr:hypothetical protein [Polyangiaceae bacterium LLY-WYZ-14_1]
MFAALLLASVALGGPSQAAAESEPAATPPSAETHPRGRILDRTAYSLDQLEARLGLFKWGFGLTNWLQIESLTLPWVAGALVQQVIPNAFLHSTLWDRGPLAIAARGGLLYVGIEEDGVFARVLLIPTTAAASYRVSETWTAHIRATYSAAVIDSELDPEDKDIVGQLATSLLHFDAMGELRLSPNIGLTFGVRWLAWFDEPSIRARAGTDDEVELEFDITIEGLENAVYLYSAVFVTKGWFNLRIGAGWGDIFALNGTVVFPWKSIVPELNVYARF